MAKIEVQTANNVVNAYIQKCNDLFSPTEIVLVTGEKDQKKLLICESIAEGECEKLGNSRYPGCLYYRTEENDAVPGLEKTTLFQDKESDTYKTVYSDVCAETKDMMKGKTMFVVPFSLCKTGCAAAKYGLLVTDNAYLVHCAEIMTRVSEKVLDFLSEDFIKIVHISGNMNEENAKTLVFCDDNLIVSLNNMYSGAFFANNSLLLLAENSFLGEDFAENMLILGVEKPDGKTHYICAAFPNEREKRDFALNYADGKIKNGHKIQVLSATSAWLKKKNGTLYAQNPDNGLHCEVKGINAEKDTNEVAIMHRNTIFTNLCYCDKSNTIWWEESGMEVPKRLYNWEGNLWRENMCNSDGTKVFGAHPCASFISPIKNCPNLGKDYDNSRGVPISAIIFGTDLPFAPSIMQAKDIEQGIFFGATMKKVAENEENYTPFGQNYVGDICKFLEKRLKAVSRMADAPNVFLINTNYKNKDEILDWVIKRCENNIGAKETELGFVPEDESNLFGIDGNAWQKEFKNMGEYFKTFGDNYPKKLLKCFRKMRSDLKE